MLCGKREARGRLLTSVPCDPCPAMMLEQAQKRGAHAADGGLDALLASFAHHLDRRAIRHHDQLTAAENIADGLAGEALRYCYAFECSHQDAQEARDEVALLRLRTSILFQRRRLRQLSMHPPLRRVLQHELPDLVDGLLTFGKNLRE